ncbi:diaminopimelate epimerase [Blattabacterium cuenoti]|uniref:diaminopimelate epimerase n=1 Tax=Blattabacterium cuenoti TaxID=1653831 RepID=UPI00163B911C|nr:diaminopimelate epimerase [Blattabacterium cuenoti]
MKFNFFKLNGTGNDFILIDERKYEIKDKNHFLLKKLCNRNFGIGADGIIIIKKDYEYESDFYMKYYNSNGKESTMCGNGGRCAIFFCNKFGDYNNEKEKKEFYFRSIVGCHHGFTKGNNLVSIRLIDLEKNKIKINSDYVFLNTGSPHHIYFIDKNKKKLEKINVYEEGKRIRYGSPYFNKGVNVNFVQIINNNTVKVRTYERGIENETLSCGTGVVASVIAAYEKKKINTVKKIIVKTMGGDLLVSVDNETNKKYEKIYLTGKVNFVFKGLYYEI